VAAFALVPGDVRTPGEFALQYAIALLVVGVAAVGCLYFARGNYLAYAVILWVVSLRGPLGELYGNTRPVHFWSVVTILLAGVLWALVPMGSRREAQMDPLPSLPHD
jgi:hypothetical protein